MSSNKTILLVEDDKLIRQMYIKIFSRQEEFDLILATSGRSALVKIKKDKPDIIVLDLLMEGIDGFGVLKRMRKDKISIPVIVATNADIRMANEALCMGAKKVLRKTVITPQSLLGTIKEILT